MISTPSHSKTYRYNERLFVSFKNLKIVDEDSEAAKLYPYQEELMMDGGFDLTSIIKEHPYGISQKDIMTLDFVTSALIALGMDEQELIPPSFIYHHEPQLKDILAVHYSLGRIRATESHKDFTWTVKTIAQDAEKALDEKLVTLKLFADIPVNYNNKTPILVTLVNKKQSQDDFMKFYEIIIKKPHPQEVKSYESTTLIMNILKKYDHYWQMNV